MNKIYHYDVETIDGSGIISARQHFTITELSIIAENDEFIAVNDRRFTTIRKASDKERYKTYSELNYPSVSIQNNDKCWGNRIHYTMYSETTVTPASIKKKIEREINKQFGYFIGGVDLSFIVKGAKK